MSTEKEQEINTLLENINNVLNKVGNESVSRMQEKIFAGVFVPIFAGEESLYGATLETWINFAGGPYMEVDVINNVGKVIFRVPAIYDRNTINPSAKGGLNIANIVETAQLYTSFHPNQGIAYLNNALDKCAMILKIPSNVKENLEFWNMVFKRYGREEILIDTPKTDTVVSKTSDDDFEGF